MSSEATLELLLDLKHDLGKYLLLPLALLPKGADDAAVRDALERALLRTRTRQVEGKEQAQGAREIWQRFAAELSGSGLPPAALAELERTLERALQWEHALHAQAALERAAVERDLGAVQAAIARLIDEARRG